MIEFPPEFYGLVSALWSTYQYIIFIWMASFFAGICLIGISLVVSNLIKNIL